MKNTSEPFSKEDAKKAAEIISAGGIIVYPTDTVWGIGCDATNPEAVEKVYRIKKRDSTRAMIILVDNENKVDYYVNDAPEVAFELFEVSEKPLTIILPNARNLASNLPAKDGSIAIRICSDAFCREIIRICKKPLVSTSANFSGDPTPENFSQINPDILKAADYVCTHRQDDMRKAVPSSIISLGSGGQVKIIRN